MIKQVAFVSVSLFLTCQSYGLVVGLFAAQPGYWATTLVVAWAVNMMITGVLAFTGFALPTERLLLDRYYRIAHPRWL